MEVKDKTHEIVNNSATIDVNSSIICVSATFEICKDVITNKQNPNRFAEVFKMCCEVLFDILFS